MMPPAVRARGEGRRAVSPWAFVLITLAAGAGVAALPVLAALAARLLDPDADWRAPLLLAAGFLVAFAVLISPVVAVLAVVGGGARTVAGFLAAAEVVALTACGLLLLLLRLR
jgi:hypothetical protein